jgi:hypothetical protein
MPRRRTLRGGAPDPTHPKLITKYLDTLVEASKESFAPPVPTILLATLLKGANDIISSALPAALGFLKATAGDGAYIRQMAPLLKAYILAKFEGTVADKRWANYDAAQKFELDAKLRQSIVRMLDYFADSSQSADEWLQKLQRLAKTGAAPPQLSGGARLSRRVFLSRRRRGRRG